MHQIPSLLYAPDPSHPSDKTRLATKRFSSRSQSRSESSPRIPPGRIIPRATPVPSKQPRDPTDPRQTTRADDSFPRRPRHDAIRIAPHTTTPREGSRADIDEMTVLASLVQWLQLKKYQLEVSFSVYIYTPLEKFIFCTSSIPLPLPYISSHASGTPRQKQRRKKS